MNKTHGEKSLYFVYEYNHSRHNFGENSNAINLELYKYITSNLREGPVMGGGSITGSTDLHEKPNIDLYNTFKSTIDDLQVQSVEIIDHILPWINHQLAEASFEFAQSGEDAGYAGFNTEGFKITNLWGMLYMKGEYVKSHNHFPYSLSFVYCVNAPEGSSPFCFTNGDTVHLKPGQMIVFLAHQYHHTLPNEGDYRCCLVGNALYQESRTQESFNKYFPTQQEDGSFKYHINPNYESE